jgi:Winged helix DNA-binding domain
MELTWSQVLAWRLRRQFLLADAGSSALDVVRRLAGVQAQVMSAAEQAVAVRTRPSRPGALAVGLSGGELVRTWAMRGTLHVLPVEELGTYLAPLAAARTWEKGSWQKTFLDAAGMRALTDAARELLDDGAVLTREELTDAVMARAGDPGLAEHLRSGWGAVLKPLAWQGLLVQGPPREGRITFTTPASLPGWKGLPPLEEAGPAVVLAYLGAYGPAGPAALDDWLLRGATPKKVLRGWFADLAARGLLVEVSVEGEPLWARAADADELTAARPDTSTRLLPAFDQYVLGPGTKDPHMLDPRYRAEVSRAAGWIAPVVIHAGRVAGTWEAADGAVRVRLFGDAPPIDPAELAREAAELNPGLPVEVIH